jgi:hypothetical protein
MRLALLSVWMALPLACAWSVGPVGFALGDGAAVERDEQGQVRAVRGAAISETFAAVAEATLGRAADAALTLLGRPAAARVEVVAPTCSCEDCRSIEEIVAP